MRFEFKKVLRAPFEAAKKKIPVLINSKLIIFHLYKTE